MLSCRGNNYGQIYFMAFLPFDCILKSLADLFFCPLHKIGLLAVRTGAGMDEEADRKVTKQREDAQANTTILPGSHSLIL